MITEQEARQLLNLYSQCVKAGDQALRDNRSEDFIRIAVTAGEVGAAMTGLMAGKVKPRTELNPKVPMRVRRQARPDVDGVKGLPALPQYQTPGSAGMDVHAFIPNASKGWFLLDDRAVLIPTGLFIEIPEGFEIQVRSRSGLSNRGIDVAGGVRTIDSDFRGELRIPLTLRPGAPPHTVKDGDRIAQLVLSPAPQARWVITNKLSETERGSGGFGSTGSR